MACGHVFGDGAAGDDRDSGGGSSGGEGDDSDSGGDGVDGGGK